MRFSGTKWYRYKRSFFSFLNRYYSYLLCLYGIQNEARSNVSLYRLKIFTTRKFYIIVSAILYNLSTIASHKTGVVAIVGLRTQGIRIGVKIACANKNVGHATKVDYLL